VGPSFDELAALEGEPTPVAFIYTAAADALEDSPRYRETVARIGTTGFLIGQSQIERFTLHGKRPARIAARRTGRYVSSTVVINDAKNSRLIGDPAREAGEPRRALSDDGSRFAIVC
jgi:hypothetical protein